MDSTILPAHLMASGTQSRSYTLSLGFWLTIGIGGYLVCAPNLQLVPEIGLYNSKRIVEVGIMGGVGIALLLMSSVRCRWFGVWDRLPTLSQLGLGLILALGILSALWAPRPVYAGLEVAHFVVLLLLTGLVASVVQDNPQLAGRIIVGVAVVSALLYAVQFSVGIGLSLASTEIAHWPKGFTGFANIRHFNQYQTWTLPLLVVPLLWLPKNRRALRFGAFGLAALWWALIFASNVRGTVLAMIIAAAVVFLVFRHQARAWLRYQALALMGGGALYLLLFYVILGTEPLLADRLSDASEYTGRLAQWQAAIELAVHQPFLGAGPMHYAWPANYFGVGAHPHNALVQWIAEWGVPSALMGGGLVLWGFGAWVRQSRRVAGRRTAGIRVALTASLVAAAAHAMVSGIIVMPVSQMWGVLIIGGSWGLFLASQFDVGHQRSRSTLAHAGLCGLVGLSMLIVVGQSIQDVRAMQERRAAFLEAVDRNLLSPRYWQQGFIGVRDLTADRVQLDAAPHAHAQTKDNTQ